MHDQAFLNKYFSTKWERDIDNYIYSGYAIADKIKNNESVLDVGCGSNPFKGIIPNLIGIDPANESADVVCTIEEFTSDQKFDVALCLGSINFGTDAIIANQIDKINQLLNQKAKIFWRLNPGQHDHGNEDHKQIAFYPWTFEKLKDFADQFGFEQSKCAIDSTRRVKRLYAEWHR